LGLPGLAEEQTGDKAASGAAQTSRANGQAFLLEALMCRQALAPCGLLMRQSALAVPMLEQDELFAATHLGEFRCADDRVGSAPLAAVLHKPLSFRWLAQTGRS
jgi:hypothetical protein